MVEGVLLSIEDIVKMILDMSITYVCYFPYEIMTRHSQLHVEAGGSGNHVQDTDDSCFGVRF